MANNKKENKIEKFTKEAIGKTLNQFNKEIGMADLVEINKNQDRILNGILSQVNDENTEKTEKSNIITLDNSTDGIVELKEIQGDTNVNVSKIEEMPITHDIGEKEGNVFTLNEITQGAINIDNIQGNTMVNCNKEADKELILMEDLSTEGYSNVTLTEGVDGGKVDVALEGNTMVNVCDQKDPIAITKSYTVKTGNHVALQGEYDGKCRPVVTGNTLVNLFNDNNFSKYNYGDLAVWDGNIFKVTQEITSDRGNIASLTYKGSILKQDTVYTFIIRTKGNFAGFIFDNNFTTQVNNEGDGIHKLVFTYNGSSTDGYRIWLGTSTPANLEVEFLTLLEGDYTNKPIPSYFEGLKSSFEDKVVTQEMIDTGEELAENLGKYKVDYVVTGKNKVNDIGYIPSKWSGEHINHKVCDVNLIQGKTYTFSCSSSISDYRVNIKGIKDGVEAWSYQIYTTRASFTLNYECDYFYISAYKFTNEDGAINIQLEEGDTATAYEPYKEYKKTFYLNSPLLEGDTIEQSGNNVVHVHRYGKVVLDGSEAIALYSLSEDYPDVIGFYIQLDDMKGVNFFIDKYSNTKNILPGRLDINYEAISITRNFIKMTILKSKLNTVDLNGIKSYLQNNPITIVYDLQTPQYEVISPNDTILCDSYVNGHLDIDSVVPIERVDFLPFIDKLTYLYPSTQYAVQFVSDAVSKVDITLGGAKLSNQDVVVGTNKYMITTSSELVNNKLILNGEGFNASNIVVTQATDKEFGYFEGMKSVGECEDSIEILSCNIESLGFIRGNYIAINPPEINTDFTNWYTHTVAIEVPRNSYINWVTSDKFYVEKMLFWNDDKYIDCATYSGYKIPNDANKLIFVFANSKKYPNRKVELYDIINDFKLYVNNEFYDWIPKSNTQTLTHEPLRAVGDAKDKYVQIDGKWYIERNCGEEVFDGSDDEKWDISPNDWRKNNSMTFAIKFTNAKGYGWETYDGSKSMSDKIPSYGDAYLYINDVFGYTNDNDNANKRFRIPKSYLSTQDVDGFRQWLAQNPVTVVYELRTPTYEPIDYNPFTVYSDTTHISNNSTIPCNMTIKNTGYNCLLKPSTTYTVSSNLGLNVVTTPTILTEDCLRFYDTDTSTVTTMKNVTILEGDYTTGKPIPSHFSGIESAFEQEYDEAVGKYKVKIRVQNEDASKENYIEFYIDKPLRGIGDVKDRVYIKDDKVIVERNCGSVTLDGSETIKKWVTSNNCYFININKNMKYTQFGIFCLCDTLKAYSSINLYNGALGIGNDEKKNIIINLNKDDTYIKQWLQQNPTTVVYQLAEPTHEEVEYSSNRLILNTFNNESFNNSTLFLDTNISPKLSFKPLWEELVYVKNSTKYYIQFNAVGSGEVVINLGGTELTTEIVEGYNCIPITTPSESTNLMTISGQGITISEVVVSEVVCGGYYKGLQSCFEEHMENGKYRILLRGIALDGSKVNGIKLYINEPLRGVDGVKDRLCIKNGKLMVERKCGEVVFDGSDDEIWDILLFNFVNHTKAITKNIPNLKGTDNYRLANSYCDKFIQLEESLNFGNDTQEYYAIGASAIEISINNSKLSSPNNVNGIKKWLQQNPTKITYELKNPVYEEVTNEYGLPIVFEGYENGIVYIDSAVTPTTHIKYTSNNQLATTLAEAEEQNIATQEDINMNVITYMMDIDMMLTDMEMSNDISVMAVRRDNSNENMLDRMSDEDKKVYRDNTVVMLEKMITANVLDKEDIEGRIDMYYNKNRISKEQYKYLKSLL